MSLYNTASVLCLLVLVGVSSTDADTVQPAYNQPWNSGYQGGPGYGFNNNNNYYTPNNPQLTVEQQQQMQMQIQQQQQMQQQQQQIIQQQQIQNIPHHQEEQRVIQQQQQHDQMNRKYNRDAEHSDKEAKDYTNGHNNQYNQQQLPQNFPYSQNPYGPPGYTPYGPTFQGNRDDMMSGRMQPYPTDYQHGNNKKDFDTHGPQQGNKYQDHVPPPPAPPTWSKGQQGPFNNQRPASSQDREGHQMMPSNVQAMNQQNQQMMNPQAMQNQKNLPMMHNPQAQQIMSASAHTSVSLGVTFMALIPSAVKSFFG
jgi:hypothetical protein